MAEIILTKESELCEIESYFYAVLKLSQSDNEFPVNLDEVWQLAYQRKDHATRDLASNFIQDIDFKVFLRNGENPKGGRPTNEYFLTVSCLEFLIARKIRSVFEVYRKVFHLTIGKTMEDRVSESEVYPDLTTRVKVELEWVKGVSDILNLNDVSKLSLLGKVAKPLNLPLPDYVPSKGVLKSATALLKEKGYSMSAQAFYKKAIELGYVENMSRNSSGGKVRHFNNITAKGLEYGENCVNPNNPKSTQPEWYVDKFDQLMSELGF